MVSREESSITLARQPEVYDAGISARDQPCGESCRTITMNRSVTEHSPAVLILLPNDPESKRVPPGPVRGSGCRVGGLWNGERNSAGVIKNRQIAVPLERTS